MYWKLIVKIFREKGVEGVIHYCTSLPDIVKPRLPFQRVSKEPEMDVKMIDISNQDNIYILECLEKVVDYLACDSGVQAVTERHLDIKIFGTVLSPLEPWIYREIASRVSKRHRKGTSGKAGYLCDYLRVVITILVLRGFLTWQIPTDSRSMVGVELGVFERVGSTPESPTRDRKIAKALRLSRWQLYDIISDAPASTPTSLL